MAEILSFYSRAPGSRRPQRVRLSKGPGVVVLGPPTKMLDCRILGGGDATATLGVDFSDPASGAVLIDLASGQAHYGRIEAGADQQASFKIVETHDLDAPGAPHLLRRIWLDRTLTEGADWSRQAARA